MSRVEFAGGPPVPIETLPNNRLVKTFSFVQHDPVNAEGAWQPKVLHRVALQENRGEQGQRIYQHAEAIRLKQCRAIGKTTERRCRNDAVSHERYCGAHRPKPSTS